MAEEDFVKIAETGIPFIIDEAYIEFAGLGKSHADMVKKYKTVFEWKSSCTDP